MYDLRTIHMVVADESPIFAEAVGKTLNETFAMDYSVVPVAPFDMRRIQNARPDVLILDPFFAGPLDLLVLELRAVLPKLRLVAFATRPTQDMAQLCIRLGFHAFLPKWADSAMLVRAVGVVSNGGSFIDKAFGRNLLTAPKPETHLRPLTAREAQVLKQTALGYSNRELALDLNLSPKTVDTHRSRGMSKLGLTGRASLVRFAAINGWLT